MLGVVEVGIASRKYPQELAQVFHYTEADMQVLMGPTQAVLARYAGTIKHEELIALGMVLTQVHVQKMYAINNAMAAYEQRMKAEADARKTAEAPPAPPEPPKVPEGLQ